MTWHYVTPFAHAWQAKRHDITSLAGRICEVEISFAEVDQEETELHPQEFEGYIPLPDGTAHHHSGNV